MLSKRVCKSCVASKAGKSIIGFRDEGAVARFSKWDEDDDKRWKKGIVVCRFWPTPIFPKTKEDPPKWCEYAMEHFVTSKKGGLKSR